MSGKQKNGARNQKMNSYGGYTDDAIVGPNLDCSKSPLDKKMYRQVLLPNGLRALLIQDTNAMHQLSSDRYSHLEEESSNDEDDDDDDDDDDAVMNDDDDDDNDEDPGLRMAAAAMVVGCGSFHDPPELMGLAHFCEHMLFMGSHKYPTENAFDSFVSQNGGSTNAYTECEHTIYHFEIVQECLQEALDMFVQFFTDPLFLPDAVDREIQAIESEFQMNKNSDSNRLEMLLSHTCGTKNHPMAKFSWGNTYSLKNAPCASSANLMGQLRQLYHTHYFAFNMSLVVMGAYTLDELQTHVIKCCSIIPHSPRCSRITGEHTTLPSSPPRYTWESLQNHQRELNVNSMEAHGMPFADTTLRKLYRIIPVKDNHVLQITWQIPPQKAHWKSKPADYIGHLMGHESQGSILSACKDKNWVTSCSAGMNNNGGIENASSHALFTMSFILTEYGVNQWEHVVHVVYQYIGMLLLLGNNRPCYIYDELVNMNEAAYKYQEEVSPEEFVEDMADRLAPSHALPPNRLLDGFDLLWEYDAEAIQQLLEQYLTPSNARYDLMSSTFGRAADYSNEDFTNMDTTNDDEEAPVLVVVVKQEKKDDEVLQKLQQDDNIIMIKAKVFDPQQAPEPLVENYFGTRFWVEDISHELLFTWDNAMKNGPTTSDDDASSLLALPLPNPFVPTRFDLKPRPADDSHHPLLRCSVKIQVTVGKKKEWYPAIVSKYDISKNLLELVYEDHGIQYHSCDMTTSQRTCSKFIVEPDMVGTLDKKQTKFKVVDVSGSRILKFGDESDLHVEQGTAFPHIPPPLPSSRLPILVVNEPGVKIWHAQDYKFQRPTADLRILIRCKNANKSPSHRACADLMANLCQDALVETSYLAAVCELGSELTSDDLGFVIRVHGFDDKLLHLAREILKVFCSFSCTSNKLPLSIKPDGFMRCLEVLRRTYVNAGMNASKLCTNIRLRCLRPTIWSSHAKLCALANITVEHFMSVVRSLLERISVEALHHGNCEKSDAVNVASKIIQDTIFASGCEILDNENYPLQLVLKLPLSSAHTILKQAIITPSLDPQEPNTAVEVYFQVGKDNVKERVLADLLCDIIHEPLFDRIRTKEQFGYEVFCAPRFTHGIIGISFKVVTASRSADEVSHRIERFLQEFGEELVQMKQDVFAKHLAGLASNKLQMYNSLEEERNVWWSEILDGRYEWEAHRNEALQLKSLVRSEMSAAYDEWLLPTSNGCPKQRRCLIVHVIGASSGPASQGRPALTSDSVGGTIDAQVEAYHAASTNVTWGKLLFPPLL